MSGDIGRSWADIVRAGTRQESRILMGKTNTGGTNTMDESADGRVAVGSGSLAEPGDTRLRQCYTSTSRSSTNTSASSADGSGGQVDRYAGFSPLAPVVSDTNLATSGLDEIDDVSEAGMFDHWDGDDMGGLCQEGMMRIGTMNVRRTLGNSISIAGYQSSLDLLMDMIDSLDIAYLSVQEPGCDLIQTNAFVISYLLILIMSNCVNYFIHT